MNRHQSLAVGIVALAIAFLSATRHAGSWNDASRLATVESLVDRHTWVIDDSIFVRPPSESTQPHPYGPLASQMPNGTQDKLLINGHFYSDKSPVSAVVMAASYQIWRSLSGPSAAERPDLFCWMMSFLWAGGAFVCAVMGIDRLARNAHLPGVIRVLIVVSFAFATIALPYNRSVNNHILLLAVATWLLVFIDRSGSYRNAFMVGTLSGIAYTIDLGAGPVICLLSLSVFSVRSQSWSFAFVAGISAFPWIALHHALNYMIGGTIGPANANPAFFHWPGCPFNETNLTGAWPHRSVWAFAIYAADMLVGKKGLFTHQPQLWLAIAAVIVLVQQRAVRRSMLILTAGWFFGVWLLYAASSRNQSGMCVSIRWFVPLIAPAFYWLIQAIKFRPDVWKDLAILSCAGVTINIVNWYLGPWHGQHGPIVWIAVAAAGLSWAVHYHRRQKQVVTYEMPMRLAA